MKAFKYLGFFLLAVVVLITVLVAALAFVDFDRYKGVIENQVSQITGRTFRIDGDSDLSVSLVPGIVLRDVRLENAPWGSRPEMVQVGEAELQLAVIPLLSGRIEVRKLVLIDSEIVIETDENSTGNWAMGVEGEEAESLVEPEVEEDAEGLGIDLALFEVQLENAQILYRDGVSKQEMALDLEEMTINRNDLDQLVWKVAAQLNGSPVSIDGTTSFLNDLLNNRPFQSQLEGSVGNVRFSMTETVNEPLKVVDFDVKATVEAPDLTTIAKLADTELPDIAPLRLEGGISDAGDAYRIDLKGNAADLGITLAGTMAKTLDGSGVNLDYSVEAPDLKTVSVLAGTGLPELGPVNLSGKVTETGGFYGLTAAGELQDLTLDGSGRIARSFDPRGMTAAIEVNAPDLKTVSKLAGTELPATGPVNVEAGLTDAGDSYEIRFDGETGGIKASASGMVADSLDGKGIDLDLVLHAPDVQTLGEFGNVELPPVGPVDVKATLKDIEGGYGVSRLDARIGESDLRGEASVAYETRPMQVNAKLASNRLNLEPFEKEAPKEDRKAGVEPDTEAPEGSPTSDRVFTDDPLPFDKLKEINADIRLDVKSLEMRTRKLEDVAVGVKLDGGSLLVQPLQARTANGDLNGDVRIDASEKTPTVDIRMDVADVVLGEIKGLREVISGGKTTANLEVEGAGNTMHEIMSGLNGGIVLDVGEGEMDNKAINLIGADIIVQVLGAINPFGEKTDKAPVECAVVKFDITDGVATTNKGIVLETDKMFVIGNGQIDLDSEQIDIAIRTQGREALGVNVGDVTKMMGVGGTLAAPTPALDVKGTAAAGATVGAAVMTMGLSYAAQKALETTIKDRTPCLTALGKAPAQPEGGNSGKTGNAAGSGP